MTIQILSASQTDHVFVFRAAGLCLCDIDSMKPAIACNLTFVERQFDTKCGGLIIRHKLELFNKLGRIGE